MGLEKFRLKFLEAEKKLVEPTFTAATLLKLALARTNDHDPFTDRFEFFGAGNRQWLFRAE